MAEPGAGDGALVTRQSVCPLDCADTCSLSVDVQDGRIAAVRGSGANPFTRGRICAKVVHSFPDQVHGPKRIRTPLRRLEGGADAEFQAISWDEALDIIHSRFSTVVDRWGAEAIAPLTYGGPMGLLAGGSMDCRFFHRLGASLVDSSTLCAGTSHAAWQSVFGNSGGIDYEELAESRLILVWGNNITACNLHATRIIRDAQKAGARLVVVDPRRTRIADGADLHIPLLPGTDVALAYALANILNQSGGLDRAFIDRQVHGAGRFLEAASEFPLPRAAELCGVDPAAIQTLAELLTTLRPAAMSIGVAPERNRNGSAGVRAALSLMALTGNIGPAGAGVCRTSHYFPADRTTLQRPDLAPSGLRELNVMDIPRYVLDPGEETPLRALFVYNHNPVAVHPQQQRMRQALLSSDVFVVGSDITMTDSMRCADLVLPAASHFEYGDLYKAYGHRYLQRSSPVIPAQDEALSNMELFRRLARRFSFEDDCFDDDDPTLMRQAFEAVDPTLADRARDGAVDMRTFAGPGMQTGEGFDTPSGRIELYSATFEDQCGQGVPRFEAREAAGEFLLVTPASEQRINSTFGGLASQQSDLRCQIHPNDARRLALSDGQTVLLFNEHGEVKLPLEITDAVRPATLYVPKGSWLPTKDALTVNALIPDRREAAIGGACYYDCGVDLKPA